MTTDRKSVPPVTEVREAYAEDLQTAYEKRCPPPRWLRFYAPGYPIRTEKEVK
jgi:hypothetical protein